MLSFMNETHFKVLFEFSTIQYALSLPIIWYIIVISYMVYIVISMTMCALSTLIYQRPIAVPCTGYKWMNFGG